MNDDGGPDRDARPRGRSILGTIPWWTVLRDAILVVAWVGIVSFAWGLFGWPSWAYYIVVFGGILGYSVTGGPWR